MMLHIHWKSTQKQKIFFVYTIFLFLVAISLVAGFYVRLLILEQLVSFTPIVAILIIVGGISALIIIFLKRRTVWRRSIVTTGLAVALGLYGLIHSLTIQPQATFVHASGSRIKFAAFNKLYQNHDIDKAAAYFAQQKIDVVSLEEAYPQEVVAMQKKLGFRYSYMSNKLNTVRGTAVGIVSRYPIVKSDTVSMSPHTSVVRIIVQAPTRQVVVYGAHISGPFTQTMYERRNGDFIKLAELLKHEKLPAVLGGDFNTTIFSPVLQEFNDSVKGRYQTTTSTPWPVCSWYSRGHLACLRIDHVYLSHTAQLTKAYIAPNLGSDHGAVVVEFSLK